jgi:hypothetical protein
VKNAVLNYVLIYIREERGIVKRSVPWVWYSYVLFLRQGERYAGLCFITVIFILNVRYFIYSYIFTIFSNKKEKKIGVTMCVYTHTHTTQTHTHAHPHQAYIHHSPQGYTSKPWPLLEFGNRIGT